MRRKSGSIDFGMALALMTVILVLIPHASHSQTSSQSVSPPAEENAQAAARKQLKAEARQLEREGKFAEAAQLLERARQIERDTIGLAPAAQDATLRSLQSLYLRAADFASAIRAADEWIALRVKLFGETDWRTADARRAQEEISLMESLTAEARDELRQAEMQEAQAVERFDQRQFSQAMELAKAVAATRRRILSEDHLKYAAGLNNLAFLYESRADYANAERLYREVLEITKSKLGDEHPGVAQSLNHLAGVYDSLQDYPRAEPLYKQALEITKATLGEDHADYAAGLNNLAVLYETRGDYDQAEPLLRQAMEIAAKTLGRKHPDYVASLHNFGMLLHLQGDDAAAEPLFRQSFEIAKEELDETHPVYIRCLQSLAGFYGYLGDGSRAESLLLQCVEITKKAYGEQHPVYARSLNSLAVCYAVHGDLARAEPLYNTALAVTKETLGEEHPVYASCLVNLALLYKNQGDLARAEALYEQALAIRKRVLGDNHPEIATNLNNLAGLYNSQGDYARAEPLLQQAAEINRLYSGDDGLEYAASLTNLATLYENQRAYARSEPLYRQALKISQGYLRSVSAVQSERQQLKSQQIVRYQLDSFLTMALAAGEYQDLVYREVLAWKGTTLARQKRIRAVTRSPELNAQWEELQRVASHLATLTLTAPAPEERESWQQQIVDASIAKERIEAQLSAASESFRESQEDVSLEALSSTMPEKTALIDYLEYKGADRRRLAAFVVQPGRGVAAVDLGAASEIGELVDQWRQSFGASEQAREAGSKLRQAIWQPLVERIADAKTVLVSCDGALGKFPLLALPGTTPGTYLIEDESLRIAIVPAPQLLPELLNGAAEANDEGKLLLMGEIDYDADAASEPQIAVASQRSAFAPRGSRPQRFKPLAEVPAELNGVAATFLAAFGAPTESLRGGAATESAFRQASRDKAYLHIATHGFFAPAEVMSATQAGSIMEQRGIGAPVELKQDAATGYSSGLLSGLVLAGANREPVFDRDDGILTSDEVATLDLSACRLCVLSACETGQGTVAGGEGLLGLQRAFQVAGARATVASLWSVEDRSTRLLMERFYANLWQKKLSTLDALREAQLWLLREGKASIQADHKARGMTLEVSDPADKSRLSPRFWAAFVLSGDWR